MITETPTGLALADLADLSSAEKRQLARWHRTKAGLDGARPWFPKAIRDLPLEARMDLATDPHTDLAWEGRELRRVRASVGYFTFAYGHFQPEEGPPIPIEPWEGVKGHLGQREVLEAFEEHLRLIVLKARQLGLTWLALHFAFHGMAFRPESANAKILALSKTLEDASKLLRRTRTINELLPPYLQQRELQETVGSLTRFKLAGVKGFEGGGGEMTSLPATPRAARSETAWLALLDEFAHVPNGRAHGIWTGVQSTLGEHGRAIVLSTGNGPPDADGDGKPFAELWVKAQGGEQRLVPIFLPASTDPRRTEEWRDETRPTYLTEEDFAAEHPETEDEALGGQPGIKVYPLDGIHAALALGRKLDALLEEGEMSPPADDSIELGIDWGEQTHGLPIWELERGGLYVPPHEVVRSHDEPSEAAQAMLAMIKAIPRWSSESDIEAVDEDDEEIATTNGHVTLGELDEARYDAAGIQSMRTFLKVARQDHPGLVSVKVPFGDYKDETIKYLRRLFRRTAAGRSTQVIAISPRNSTLLRQLRKLEFKDADAGKVKKGDDHGPDALVAGAAPVMTRWREAQK